MQIGRGFWSSLVCFYHEFPPQLQLKQRNGTVFLNHGMEEASKKSDNPNHRYIVDGYMGVSWNRDTPSHHPFLDGIFPEINQPFWGSPMTMETPTIDPSLVAPRTFSPRPMPPSSLTSWIAHFRAAPGGCSRWMRRQWPGEGWNMVECCHGSWEFWVTFGSGPARVWL